jgi:hypothetical protein
MSIGIWCVKISYRTGEGTLLEKKSNKLLREAEDTEEANMELHTQKSSLRNATVSQ